MNPLRKLGPVVTRMVKLVQFERLQIPVSSGSEPKIESLDDCTEVYRDDDRDEFGHVIELCPRAPSGQCEYSWHDNWRACIHCGREDGPGI